MEDIKKEIKEEVIQNAAPAEKDYFTKQEVKDLINQAIIENLTNLIKNNDKVETQKEETNEDKGENNIYDW